MIRSFCLALAAVAWMTAPLRAQSYPERTVTIVVPASPGGVTDFLARLLAQKLTDSLGKNVIVDNRVGGGTLIGANVVAKASPDGHTLMVMPIGTLFNSIISKTIPIDFEHGALVPVSVVGDDPLVLVVNSHLPVKNIGELIAYAKMKPGALSFGTVGPGSFSDVAVELLMKMTDTKMVGVPYGGSTPALMDLLSDRIDLLFLPLGSGLSYITAGKVQPIGVSSLDREPDVPDIPSISEGVPGYEADHLAIVDDHRRNAREGHRQAQWPCAPDHRDARRPCAISSVSPPASAAGQCRNRQDVHPV